MSTNTTATVAFPAPLPAQRDFARIIFTGPEFAAAVERVALKDGAQGLCRSNLAGFFECSEAAFTMFAKAELAKSYHEALVLALQSRGQMVLAAEVKRLKVGKHGGRTSDNLETFMAFKKKLLDPNRTDFSNGTLAVEEGVTREGISFRMGTLKEYLGLRRDVYGTAPLIVALYAKEGLPVPVQTVRHLYTKKIGVPKGKEVTMTEPLKRVLEQAQANTPQFPV